MKPWIRAIGFVLFVVLFVVLASRFEHHEIKTGLVASLCGAVIFFTCAAAAVLVALILDELTED